jgi:hypothetical protein
MIVTAHDMLVEWASYARRKANGLSQEAANVNANTDGDGDASSSSKGRGGGVIRRPHILKLDVEGHDYEVLSEA